MRFRAAALLFAALHTASVFALDLTPVCPADTAVPDATKPIAALRSRVETLMAEDPTAAVALLCSTIPRVAREQGDQSLEYAWWVGSLATPLIAFQNKLAESLPLLQTAQPLLERHLGPNAVELADIHVAYAWIYFRQGRLGEADDAWEHALHIREITPGDKQIELQKILVGLAQVRMAQRNFDGARTALDRAYRILQDNDEARSEAGAAIENAYANLALREEDYAAVRRHAEIQIEIETSLTANVMQLVPAYILLGRALERMNEFENSEAALLEAIRLAQADRGPLQRHYLAALTELGAMLNERDEPARALPYAERGLEIGTSTLGANAPRMVRVTQNLAEVRRSLGDLPEALRLYDLAAQIVAADSANVERQSLAAYYRGRGDLEWSLGEVDGARSALELGLATTGDDATLTTERAGVLSSLARTWARADPPAARAYLEQALALFQARLPDVHPTVLRVVDELCGIELRTAPRDAPYCDDALDRLNHAAAAEPSLSSAVFDNQSERAERNGNAAAARSYAILALASAETLGTPSPLWGSYFRLARLLARSGDRSLAIFFGKLSVVQIERQRERFVGEYRRLDRTFLQNKVDVYRALADWLMEAGRIGEGLEVLQLLKTQELYDFVLRSAQSSRDERVTLTAGELALQQAYTKALQADAAAGATIERLGRLDEAQRLSVNERTQLTSMLRAQRTAGAERAARIDALIAAPPRPAADHPTLPTTRIDVLDNELRRYDANTAVAVYLMTDTHLRVVIATALGKQELRIDIDGAGLRRDIGRYLDAMTRRADVRDLSRSLYTTLVKPLDDAATRAHATRLVLWLDGALRYLPIGALESPSGPMLERYTILAHADVPAEAPVVAAAALHVRGFGVTRAVAGYAALPAVADELCYLVRGPIAGLATASPACSSTTVGNGVIDGEAFTNETFTAERLVTPLNQPSRYLVLHLGTHFNLRPGNALRSFLVLGDGGKLTLERINTLDFRGVELVTLSACQTALGGATSDDGRELEALSAIVQRRGAKRVVASLWQVEDKSTASLMRSMYGAFVAAPSDAAAALRSAQLALRATPGYQHPYYWAGFVVSGS
jgi:CHAT domain-containing protein